MVFVVFFLGGKEKLKEGSGTKIRICYEVKSKLLGDRVFRTETWPKKRVFAFPADFCLEERLSEVGQVWVTWSDTRSSHKAVVAQRDKHVTSEYPGARWRAL